MTEISQPQGETLAQRLERGPLELQAALVILEHTLAALEPVHSSGAIHGRITPEVIFLTPDGGATLTGFDTASTGTKPSETTGNRIPDNPGYMAPEQLNRDFVDARADVFALGVIAYEMLIGRNPFWAGEGLPPGTMAYRIVYRPYPEIAPGSVSGLPEGIRMVLTAAMAKDPNTRFADAGAFLEALSAPVSLAIVIAPAPAPRAAARWDENRGLADVAAGWLVELRRNSAPYLVAATIVIVGLVAVLYLTVLYRGQGIAATETTGLDPALSVSATSTLPTLRAALVVESATTTIAPTTSTTMPAATTTSAETTTTVKAKVAATVALSGLSYTYSGSPRKASAKTAPEGLKVVITYGDSAHPIDPPTNAGSYKVTVTIDDAQYQGSATGTLVIHKASATINVSGWKGTYTGTTHRATASATGVRGENLGTLLIVSGSYTNVPGGTGSWSFKGNGNYNSAGGSVAIVISKANASISVSGYNHAYDGHSHGAILNYAKGVRGESLSTLISLGGQTYTNPPGGPARWTFAGNGNYSSTSGSVTIAISKASATIHVSGWSGNYDGFYHGASGSATGVSGENLSGLLNLGANFVSVGNHTAVWTFAGNNNYNSSSGSVSIDINEPPTTTAP